METMGLFDQTFSVLEKNMNLRSQKHNLLISNIANVDTPNYKAFDLLVEKEMTKGTDDGTQLDLNQTQSAHFSLKNNTASDPPDIFQIEKARYDFRDDGNSVDIDKTMSDMAENGLQYNASAQMISRKFQMLENAINGARR